jgi:hypothetical protein
MRVNIRDPLSGLSGFSSIPFDIDEKWLRERMRTGQSAEECLAEEIAKIPELLRRNIAYTARINKAYADVFKA